MIYTTTWRELKDTMLSEEPISKRYIVYDSK